MSQRVYKILLFMKRRPGMSFEAFQDYYENHHVPLCLNYGSSMSRYQRRFIVPHPNPETGAMDELQFDVITELWFDTEAAFRGTLNYLTTSVMPDAVVEDEKKLFDRQTMRMATVIECETEFKK